MAESIRFEDILKNAENLNKGIMFFNLTNDPYFLSILEEEKSRIGLENTKIDICLPEYENYKNLWTPAWTSGNKEEGYNICLIPKSIKQIFGSYRFTIRHELAHIKCGDCDLENKLPEFLLNLHYSLYGEHRANFYATKWTLEDLFMKWYIKLFMI